MAFDKEWAVLNKILETGNMSMPIQKGVRESWFKDIDSRNVWRFISDVYEKHGEVPSKEIVATQFGELFQEVDLPDGLSILTSQLREKAAYNAIMEAQKKVIAASRGGKGTDALKEMQEQALSLSVAFLESDHLDATKAAGMILERYKLIKETGGVVGMRTPWETYTRATGGYQKGITYGWYGLTGTMKTWLLLYQALYLHSMFGAVPLVLSKEVPKEQCVWRLSCLKAEVPYGKLNEGKLDDEEESRFVRVIKSLSDDPPFPVDFISNSGKGSLLEVRAKVRKHNPDIVLVDGVYFMADDPSNWGQMAVINNGLKQMAIDEELPMILSTQRNYSQNNKKIAHDETEQGDVGFGKSFAQAVDFLNRIVRDQQERERQEAAIVMSKSRESVASRFYIHAKPGESFEEKPQEPEDGGPEEADEGIVA